jgi:hypothetical protein
MPSILPRLATVAILSLVVLPSATASTSSSKCLEFESLDEIMNHATNANVLVKINREFASSGNGGNDDDESQYDELCNMYENTSEQRRGAVMIGRVVGDLHRDLAKDLGAEHEDSWPTLVLVKRGTKKITRYNGEKKAAAVAGYLKKETGATIGTFVYSLVLFDVMAARFVNIKDDDDDRKHYFHFNRLQKKLIAYASKYLSYVMTIRADQDTKAVVGTYVKVFFKSLEDGDYASAQSARIQKLLFMQQDQNKMSVKKREEMNQRLHILSKFTDPTEVTPEQRRQFYLSVGLNAVLLIAVIIMAFQLVFFDGRGGGGGDDSQNDGEDEATKGMREGAADQDDKKDD